LTAWGPLAVVAAWAALLLGVALWVERRDGRARRVAGGAAVYALAQAVYCTTWTFYGSVGFAASSGLLFLTVYLGPTLVVVFWWSVLRRMVRIKDNHRVTGLPDLLALRYARSQAVAALATVILVVGLVPYVALQLKTMVATTSLVAGRDPAWAYPGDGRTIAPAITALLLVSTIAIGLRRARPAERHPGLMAALAVESIVKLVACVAAGALVTYGLFDGFGDVFRRAAQAGVGPAGLVGTVRAAPVTWLAHLTVSAAAILALPRQFHVSVVESSDERQIRTAMWAFPAYLFAINLFVLPVALGGLLLGHPAYEADTFVLHVPYEAGHRWLSWLVYVGGISAGLGMVVVETTALATALANHLILPPLALSHRLRALRRRPLVLRWGAAAAFLAAALAYERLFGARYELASFGLVSFVAVLQLAPPLLFGLYGRSASAPGALAGLGAGFAVWAYTLVVPVLVRGDFLPMRLLTEGPFAIHVLRPEALFGVDGLDPISNAVLWSLLANVGSLALVSLVLPPAAEEKARTVRLVEALAPVRVAADLGGAHVASAGEKRARLIALFSQFHQADAASLAEACLAKVGATADGSLVALQLAELEAEAETALGASIGAAAAHAAIARSRLVTPDEARAISIAYAEVLARLRVSPSELQRKIDYHRERERLLAREAAVERFLAEVSAQLARSLDVDATAATVVHLPVPQLASAALLWIRPQGERARAWLADGDPEHEKAAAPAIASIADELQSVPFVAQAVETRRPVTGVSGGGQAWPAPISALVGNAESVTVPLVARRRTLGTLSLFVDPQSALRLPADLGIAEELAHRSAIALENAALFTDAQEAIRARDEFLAIASHELKTPLTPLRISIQALRRAIERGNVAPERLEQLFGTTDQQVIRLAGLVEDLLDATRIGTRRLRLDARHTDLCDVVRAVVERHRDELSHAGCEITLRLPEHAVGEWDRARLEQVFTNLVTNAMKYAPGRPITVAVEASAAAARLLVHDEGPGIAPADQERIFRPFERATSFMQVSGFGLGLYIVREIAAAHGGTVRVESTAGAGSTFVVELPRHHGAA
jgi:signal transduction histidine kinase/Na+/proline symporter